MVSLSATTSWNGVRASCWRWKMFASRAAIPTTASAATTAAATSQRAVKWKRRGREAPASTGSVIPIPSGSARSSDPVSDVRVAADARDGLAGQRRMRAGRGPCGERDRTRAMVDGFGDLGVTVAAGALGDLAIRRRDAQRVGVAAGGEVEGVPESVARLHDVLADEVV